MKKPDWKIESEKHEEKLEKTSGRLKILNYLIHLALEDDNFRKRISDIRKKLKIPKGGYEKVIEKKGRYGGTVVYYPDSVDKRELRDQGLKLAEDYALDIFCADVFENYIVYDNLNMSLSYSSLIWTEDIRASLLGQFSGDTDFDRQHIEDLSARFPVALMMSPYISERDLIDYIKKLFKTEIEPKLKEYRSDEIKLGKVRKKNFRVAQRNQFIWENRDVPIRKLVGMIAEKFKETLDYTYIQKIIKKGRKLSEYR